MTLLEFNKDKIGNLMVLLASRIPSLPHKNLIKLLYLIDETAVKDGGVPITWLEYQAWCKGPVAPAVYNMKQSEENMFSDYIQLSKNKDNTTIVNPVVKFKNDAFSIYAMDIIDEVIALHGRKDFEQLSRLTHQPSSPWTITKEQNNIPDNEDSSIVINIDLAVKDDEDKKSIYKEAAEVAMLMAQMAA